MEPSPDPKVTLIGHSGVPFRLEQMATIRSGRNRTPGLDLLQVIAIVWEQSKSTKPLGAIINEVLSMDVDALGDLLGRVMEGVPVVEAVSFTFIIENASIGWREQMVRHRVGSKPDVRVGADWITVDTVPEVADMSAWSQSMRLLDMSRFAEERRYRTPDSIKQMGPRAVERWHNDMMTIQRMYARWVEDGVPREDARDLIGLGATSRLAWTLNLRTLQHIVGKRGCTILQLGYWGPIINGIINELAEAIHPVFRRLVTPPCIKGERWTGCIFPEDNARRMDGRDENLPVCPLFIGREQGAVADKARALHGTGKLRLMEDVEAEALRRAAFWGRDPWTGRKLGDHEDPVAAALNANY